MPIYIVQTGDTLDDIAARYGVSPLSLSYDNQIPYPYRLAVGQAIYIASNASRSLDEGAGVYRGGYAYPFISRYVLNESLPYLTDLYVFSYGFTAQGALIPPALDSTSLVTAARDAGVSPILTLTPFGPDGRFNNSLITVLLSDQTAIETLKQSLIDEIQTAGYEGLDIDFEYILATDREAFVSFTQTMQEALSPLGYTVSVALAPKTSSEQTGLLYEGKDYAGLGAVADYVLLMTYEWGYTYGLPMAVAPLNKVREVVDYAITVIPPAKIHLGIPNYGYDWPLPYMQGITKATTIGNVEAVQIAIEQDAAIQFDALASSPWFSYSVYGQAHEVWFEDVRSYQAKFDLVKEYGLRGISIWQIMRLYRAGLLLLRDSFTFP